MKLAFGPSSASHTISVTDWPPTAKPGRAKNCANGRATDSVTRGCSTSPKASVLPVA